MRNVKLCKKRDKIRQERGRWQISPSTPVPVQVTFILGTQISHEELRPKIGGILNLIFKKLRMIWDPFSYWRKEWPPTPVFLPGESHGQRSLTGYSPWGEKESDMTEWFNTWHIGVTLPFFQLCPFFHDQSWQMFILLIFSNTNLRDFLNYL